MSQKQLSENEVQELSLEEIYKLCENWALHWEEPNTKLRVLKEIENTVPISPISKKEIRELITVYVKQIKEKERHEKLELKEKVTEEEREYKKKLELEKAKQKDEQRQLKEELREREIERKARRSKDYALARNILIHLNKEEFDQATELMVEDILENESIFTLRSDIKPEIWTFKEGIIVPEGKTRILERCREVLGEAYNQTFAFRVVAKIQTETYQDEEQFFKEEDANLIAVKNGVVDIRTKKIYGFNPEYRFFSKIPIRFDPIKECPKIIAFLKDVLSSEEELLVVQELFGFLLIRDYFIETSFMFHGGGRNGKTKLLDLIKRFIGSDNCADISLQDLDKDNFALGELHKKLANVSGDLSNSALEHTGNFKKLTGRDLISAARKFLTRIHFVNYAKMIFAANELPQTKDLTQAFFLRWIILTFPYTFLPQKEIDKLSEEEKENVKLQNPHIIDQITSEEELSGLFNWALEGLTRLRENKQFSYSPSTKEIKEKWLRASSSVEGFWIDCCEHCYDSFITKEQFMKRYTEYCKSHKLKIFDSRKIKDILENKGVEDSKKWLLVPGSSLSEKEQKRGWLGLRFKDS